MKNRRCIVCGEKLSSRKKIVCGKKECREKRNRFLVQKRSGNPNPSYEEQFDYILSEISRKEAIKLLKQGEEVLRDKGRFYAWVEKKN